MLDNQPTDEEMNYRQQICRSTDGFQNCMDVASKQQESSKENGNKKEQVESGKSSRNYEEMDFILRP